jgi:hypothetical protein
LKLSSCQLAGNKFQLKKEISQLLGRNNSPTPAVCRTPLFAGFIRNANVIIDRYANQLAIHKGRLAAKKDDEDAPLLSIDCRG